MNLKHKALNIEVSNRQAIIDALRETERIHPDKDKILLLMNTYNTLYGGEVFTWSSYARCGDCRRSLQQFWKYVIFEWQRT
jgi:hypothetical protein